MKKIVISKVACILVTAAMLASSLTGCAAAASSDWVGSSPSVPADEAEKSGGSVADEGAGAVVDSDTAEAEGQVADDSASEEITDGDTIEEDDSEEESTDVNNDVTAGSYDGEDWSAEAYIGDDNSVGVTVYANKSSMAEEKVDSADAIKDKAGDLDKARLKWLTAYYEGDEDSAKEDMEDFKDIDSPSDTQISEVKKYADDLGKLFKQFGVTDYDLSAPDSCESDEVEYDVYTSKDCQFKLTIGFDEGTLSTIDFSLEEM